MKTEVSRRQFLTGVGLAGLAAAGAGLAGCTPSSNTSTGGSNAAGGGAATSSNGLIAAASLNPQDYDYRQNTTDFKTLFSPFSIGSIQLNHRMVKSAAGSACYLNGPADELLEYYVNFAKGGVEMIWVEGIPWLEPGPQFPPSDISAEDGIAFGKKLVEECGKYGATLGYQWAPFAMSEPGDMTVDQITASEDGGAAVALQCKQMGFKAVEINSAGFNMGHHFLTRFHNTRTDDYGVGSLENRARFVTESIQKMKKACGDDFVVQVLIDCIEENDDLSNAATLMTMDNMVTFPHTLVTTIEEGIEFAKLFEAAGCDSMHLRLGPLSNHPCQFGSDLYFILNGIEGSNGYGIQWDFSKHWQGQLRANHSGAGMLIDIAARYKEALSIPCGTVTYMDPAHAPDYFEQALADGKIDFYIMNRPLTVDTEYVNKLKAGKIDEIAPCCRCLHCHIGGNPDNARDGYCRVNAMTQRVYRPLYTEKGGPISYDLPGIDSPKNVMVIGGGPGGMEAARIAAARGHNVTLYEKSGALGGKLDFASRVKGPHENLDDLKAYLAKQQDVNGVTVVLNKEVDAAFIDSEAPDAVILATGGVSGDLPVTPDSSVAVVDFDSFETAQVGQNVVIYGSSAEAFDCALWMTVHGKRVVMVTPDPNTDLDKEQSQHAMRYMTTSLYALGFKAWAGATLKSIANGQVTLTTDVGTTQIVDCDTIISGAQLKADTSLINGISVKETYTVGDCATPYNMARAIQAGNDAGRTV